MGKLLVYPLQFRMVFQSVFQLKPSLYINYINQ